MFQVDGRLHSFGVVRRRDIPAQQSSACAACTSAREFQSVFGNWSNGSQASMQEAESRATQIHASLFDPP